MEALRVLPIHERHRIPMGESTSEQKPIPNNLPARIQPFVDREEELRQVTQALFDPDIPIVTIAGMAGIGKTALALEVAYRLLDQGQFVGGICWLNCRSDNTLEAIHRTIQTTFDLVSVPIAQDEVRRYLRTHPCLLILDGYDEAAQDMEILAFLDRLSQPSGQTRLRQILSAYFNESELRTLCFDLDISYDDLPGEGKVDKARELTAHLDRRALIPELINACRKQRPDISWESTPEAISKALLTSRQDVGLPGRSRMYKLGGLTERQRAEATEDEQDRLDAAPGIALLEKMKAMRRKREEDSRLLDHLNNLATTESERYARTGRFTDLEQAIAYYRQALTLGLTLSPHPVFETARQIVEFGKRLFDRDQLADVLTMARELNDVLDSAGEQTKARNETPASPGQYVLIREPALIYQTSAPYDPAALQAAALVKDMLFVIASVASVRMDGSPPAEYGRALQALELARQVDKATSETFELAKWVREASCYEFVELEGADRWPPRLAHLVHLAARYERDENWSAAIDTYRQARALLDPHKGEEELTRYTELGFRLGLCLKQDGRWSEALKQQEGNVAGYKKLGNPYGKASAYLEMGHIYQMMNVHDLALLYYGEAYYLYQKATEAARDEAVRWSAQRGMADAKESLGNLEFQLKLFPKSLSDLVEAEKLYITLGMPGKAVIMRQTLESVQEPAGGPYD